VQLPAGSLKVNKKETLKTAVKDNTSSQLISEKTKAADV